MSLAGFLTTVVRILDEVGVPYMQTGSLAAAQYALPRATRGIGLVIEASETRIRRLVDGLDATGLHVSREEALEALETQGQFNAIDPESGWKADLILRKDRSFSATEFARRAPARIFGANASVDPPIPRGRARIDSPASGH